MFLCNAQKGPVVVSYYGEGGDSGQWACRAHRQGTCADIKLARKNPYFQRLYGSTSEERSVLDSDEEQPLQEERERGKLHCSRRPSFSC